MWTTATLPQSDPARAPAPPRLYNPGLPPKIAAFLRDARPASPCLVVDLDLVAQNYQALTEVLPDFAVHYAVKANPARPILARLLALGSRFDVASPNEIALCLEMGADPAQLSYGSTIKKARDIAQAAERGVSLFAFDSLGELDKLAREAPGARVFCRLFVDNSGAEWPLSRKFGCGPAAAIELLAEAGQRGLVPAGLAFHVGSQQGNLSRWDEAMIQAAQVFEALDRQGIGLDLLNIGGGLPSQYRRAIPPIAAYGAAIRASLARRFGTAPRNLVVEPGRYLVGDAGVIEAEVVLTADREQGESQRRWVYLDVGRFSGLAETEGEAIQYRILTDRDDEPTVPAALAGPSCDSADVLYDSADYRVPIGLMAGDKLRFLAAGAYTTVYAAAGFNGIAPMDEHYI